MRTLTVLITILLAGCALPGTSGSSPSDLEAQCGPIALGWPVPSPIESRFDPLDGDIEDYVDDEARVEFDLQSPTEWYVVEESSNELVVLGVISSDEGPGHQFARFERSDGEWRASSWGGCNIEVGADGYGSASFSLDPSEPPDPAASEITVLANERACASGQAPAGRMVAQLVVESDRHVDINLLVEDPDGDQTCQGNPDFEVIVELSAPLGDRTIRDASVHPPSERSLD